MGIIVSVVNLFIGSSMLAIGLDWFILLLFCGLTAYDIQKMKIMQGAMDENRDKLYIYFAMQLYLDFINIFFSKKPSSIISILTQYKDTI